MSVAVKLTNVVKRFGALEVLKGVSFEINAGEVVARRAALRLDRGRLYLPSRETLLDQMNG